MSEENVEIVRRAVDAYNRSDLEGFGELLDPDVVWQPGPSWPEVRARHGREEVLQLLADVREPLDRNETVLENLVDAGDRVVVRQVWRGVLKGTADEIVGTLGVIVTFREGKVTEVLGTDDECRLLIVQRHLEPDVRASLIHGPLRCELVDQGKASPPLSVASLIWGIAAAGLP